MVELEQHVSLLSVLGEPLQHCGTRRIVQFTVGDGCEMRVNFKVTDATRPILSVKKGADTGAMTNFKPCGEGKTIREATAIQKITQILRHDVHGNGAYLLDTKKTSAPVDSTCNQQQTGTSLEPSGKRNTTESAPCSPRSTRRIWTSPARTPRNNLQNPHKAAQQEWTEHEVTHCPYRAWREICVSATCLGGQHRRQKLNEENIPVIEFD